MNQLEGYPRHDYFMAASALPERPTFGNYVVAVTGYVHWHAPLVFHVCKLRVYISVVVFPQRQHLIY